MSEQSRPVFQSVEAVQAQFVQWNYIADRALALTVKLAADLEKPLLLEGEAGVGKTEVAKVLAGVLNTPLIRLQCYEGLDAQTTLYEWNYARQILHIRMAEQQPQERPLLERTIFGDEFLLNRPLLEAIRHLGSGGAGLSPGVEIEGSGFGWAGRSSWHCIDTELKHERPELFTPYRVGRPPD